MRAPEEHELSRSRALARASGQYVPRVASDLAYAVQARCCSVCLRWRTRRAHRAARAARARCGARLARSVRAASRCARARAACALAAPRGARGVPRRARDAAHAVRARGATVAIGGARTRRATRSALDERRVGCVVALSAAAPEGHREEPERKGKDALREPTTSHHRPMMSYRLRWARTECVGAPAMPRAFQDSAHQKRRVRGCRDSGGAPASRR